MQVEAVNEPVSPEYILRMRRSVGKQALACSAERWCGYAQYLCIVVVAAEGQVEFAVVVEIQSVAGDQVGAAGARGGAVDEELRTSDLAGRCGVDGNLVGIENLIADTYLIQIERCVEVVERLPYGAQALVGRFLRL